MLSAMQQRIYDYIAACIQTQGYPPSVREIGEAVGLRSPSTVHFHLKKLADAGVIEIGAGKGRAITLTHPAAPSVPEPEEPADRVPIVGNVAAGSPILAQECIEDYLTFHTGHPGDVHFALRVRGESMLNAGILPGDLVVVRQQQTCNQGEIVVALSEAVKQLACWPRGSMSPHFMPSWTCKPPWSKPRRQPVRVQRMGLPFTVAAISPS